MSQLLAPRTIAKTQKQPFTKEDQTAMQVWSGFTGFKLSEKTKVCNLFTEHTENADADKEKFVIPERSDGNPYCPETETEALLLSSRIFAFCLILHAAFSSSLCWNFLHLFTNIWNG